MDGWFNAIAEFEQLPAEVVARLDDDGFVIISGPIPCSQTSLIAQAYDYAVATADPTDVSHGSTTTRVNDMVNRTDALDQLYVYLPLLKRVGSLSINLSSSAQCLPEHCDHAHLPSLCT